MSNPLVSRRAALAGIGTLVVGAAGCAGFDRALSGESANPSSAATTWLPEPTNRPGETLGRVREYRPQRLVADDHSATAVSTAFLDSEVRITRYTESPITLSGVRRRDLTALLTNPGQQGLRVRQGGGVGDAMRDAIPDSFDHVGTTAGFDVYVGRFAVVAASGDAVVSFVHTYETEYKRAVVEAVVRTRDTDAGFATATPAEAAFAQLGDPVLANVPTRLDDPASTEAAASPKRVAFDGFTGLFGSLSVDGTTAVSRGVVLYDESAAVPTSALRTWLGLGAGGDRPDALSRYSDVELVVDEPTATLVARRPRTEATPGDVQPLPV